MRLRGVVLMVVGGMIALTCGPCTLWVALNGHHAGLATLVAGGLAALVGVGLFTWGLLAALES
ncbi:MAG TPA: hypothetical protein VFC47_02300 [Caulobacteraceae bacterium]|nr:hypothetical protein [Caulobacteraceae bacterium]